jgi:hypothetical protein
VPLIDLERAVRLELTIPDLQSGALAAWRRALIGAEGGIRTLEASLEDSHVSSYITSAFWSAPAERSGNGALDLGRGLHLQIPKNDPKRRRAALAAALQSWNSWQDSNPQPRRSKRRALPVELQEQKALPIVDLRLLIDSGVRGSNRKSAIGGWQ